MRKLIGLSAMCSMAAFSFSVSGLETMRKLAVGETTFGALNCVRSVTHDFEGSSSESEVFSDREEKEPAIKKMAVGTEKCGIEAGVDASAPAGGVEVKEKKLPNNTADQVSDKKVLVDQKPVTDAQDKGAEKKTDHVVNNADSGKQESSQRKIRALGNVDFNEINAEIEKKVVIKAVQEDCKCPEKVENVEDLIQWIRYSKDEKAKVDEGMRVIMTDLVKSLYELGAFYGLKDEYTKAVQYCKSGGIVAMGEVCARCILCMQCVWGDSDDEKGCNVTPQSSGDAQCVGEGNGNEGGCNVTPRPSGKKRRRSLFGKRKPGSENSSCNVTPRSSAKGVVAAGKGDLVDTASSSK